MKYLVAILFAAQIAQASADTFDHGYYRADGSYVTNHIKQLPNDRTSENYWSNASVDAWSGVRTGGFTGVTAMAWQ